MVTNYLKGACQEGKRLRFKVTTDVTEAPLLGPDLVKLGWLCFEDESRGEPAKLVAERRYGLSISRTLLGLSWSGQAEIKKDARNGYNVYYNLMFEVVCPFKDVEDYFIERIVGFLRVRAPGFVEAPHSQNVFETDFVGLATDLVEMVANLESGLGGNLNRLSWPIIFPEGIHYPDYMPRFKEHEDGTFGPELEFVGEPSVARWPYHLRGEEAIKTFLKETNELDIPDGWPRFFESYFGNKWDATKDYPNLHNDGVQLSYGVDYGASTKYVDYCSWDCNEPHIVIGFEKKEHVLDNFCSFKYSALFSLSVRTVVSDIYPVARSYNNLVLDHFRAKLDLYGATKKTEDVVYLTIPLFSSSTEDLEVTGSNYNAPFFVNTEADIQGLFGSLVEWLPIPDFNFYQSSRYIFLEPIDVGDSLYVFFNLCKTIMEEVRRQEWSGVACELVSKGIDKPVRRYFFKECPWGVGRLKPDLTYDYREIWENRGKDPVR
jgi:hypothetical protein